MPIHRRRSWLRGHGRRSPRGRSGPARLPPSARPASPSVSWQTSRPCPHAGRELQRREAMPEAVITGGARTAVGRLLGSLKDFTAADLGGIVINAALARSGLAATDPEYVIMGQVLQAGAGQIPARQAAVIAGTVIGMPAITINKVCLSGLDAIAL